MTEPTATRRGDPTRDRILAAAERLFAEHGVYAVSNRQVGEAAGQGNNSAVGYHFGGKLELVRAIVDKHDERVERRRLLLRAEPEPDSVRGWVDQLVRPPTEHLAELGVPSWFARFNAQVNTDPRLRAAMYAHNSPELARVIEGLDRELPPMPRRVRAVRGDMARNLIVHMCAEHERALADGTAAEPGWARLTDDLVDAIVGMVSAPVRTVTD